MGDTRLQRPTGAPWDDWRPTERATLCFVVRDGWILLIHKKRGLGAGKINGPGGRLEPGETPLEAAVRETQEEVGVTPLGVALRGELFFQFVDGYALECSVFTANDCEGDLIETDEAKPIWTRVAEIPFGEMWADDVHWLPGVLEGGCFRGFFEFDGDQMLSKNLIWVSSMAEFQT
ncbi:MAG: 8-oxo-dGTP diphosphatase [Chthoniobacterales bacterium]